MTREAIGRFMKYKRHELCSQIGPDVEFHREALRRIMPDGYKVESVVVTDHHDDGTSSQLFGVAIVANPDT